MTDKAQRTIHIKWVRSGIGFSRRQKAAIRSLGLRRLHQVVERADIPAIRGLVARVAHLVEIVREAPKPAPWTSIPESTIRPQESKPAARAVSAATPAAEEAPAASGAVVEAEAPSAAETEQPSGPPGKELKATEPTAEKAKSSETAQESQEKKAETAEKASRASGGEN